MKLSAEYSWGGDVRCDGKPGVKVDSLFCDGGNTVARVLHRQWGWGTTPWKRLLSRDRLRNSSTRVLRAESQECDRLVCPVWDFSGDRGGNERAGDGENRQEAAILPLNEIAHEESVG